MLIQIYNSKECFEKPVDWCQDHAKFMFAVSTLVVCGYILLPLTSCILQPLCILYLENTEKKPIRSKKQNFLRKLENYWIGQQEIILENVNDIEYIWDVIWGYSWSMEKDF